MMGLITEPLKCNKVLFLGKKLVVLCQVHRREDSQTAESYRHPPRGVAKG